MITGGKNYVSAPPAFSNDAKRLLVCSSRYVSIFSVSTGLQIGSLEGHKALVTSVVVVPASGPASKIMCYCWTSSLDGTIRYWDFSVPELLKTVDIKLPIFSMVIPSLLGEQSKADERPTNNVFAYISIENAKGMGTTPKTLRGQIRKCNLTKSRLATGILGETKQPEFMSICLSGKFFGIRNKRKIQIWKTPDVESEHLMPKKITLHHTKDFTTLTFHPTKRILAAGDVTGRILVFRGFGSQKFLQEATEKSSIYDEERPGVRGNDDADSCSTWHWHPAEVSALAFSSDGAYLYSGGREGVLVVWQLDTGKKKYLPRIGSPLVFFTDSPDPLLSSISCADNQIHMLKMPSLGIVKSISGIKLPCPLPESYQDLRNGFSFDQNSGLVALRTENYCIQFFSLLHDRGISEVQILERNHQPGDDVTVVVTSVSLSLDGAIMSTTEVRISEDGIGGFVCLKFWESEPQARNFSLSTVIYEPHRNAGISAVAFHPTLRMAVSTSYGGDFKIWVYVDDKRQKNKGSQSSGWMCHAVGSYKKKAMTAASFSSDGSILAVAAETVITLWDPLTNVLIAVIGETLTPIVTLAFAGATDKLVSVSQGSRPQLCVWNLSTLSISWSYKLHIEAVACSGDLSSFAVLALVSESIKEKLDESTYQGRDGMILFFNSNDPVPVGSWSVRKAEGGGLSFLRANQSSLEGDTLDGKQEPLLVYINGDHEYVIFDPHGKDIQYLQSKNKENALPEEEGGQFGYKTIYGDLPEFNATASQTSWVSPVPSQRPWETIFNGPSHALPSLNKLCASFLESLLERRTISAE